MPSYNVHYFVHSEEIVHILEQVSRFVGRDPDRLTVTEISRTKNPYAVLVSTLLSLRARDESTRVSTQKLLSAANTAQAMVELGEERIGELIRPINFWRTKSKTIFNVSKELIDKYDGIVPKTIQELVEFKGVGRKTANLVMTHGHGLPGLCVDTHLHRLSNRIGFFQTKKPLDTEVKLRGLLPMYWWDPINGVLISFGRNHCTPQYPKCSTCPIYVKCHKIGVQNPR